MERRLGFSGKEEWVLRWLLKKLDTQDIGVRLDPRVWSLMGALVERIPVENAARILSGHKLLRTLEQSLAAGLAGARAASSSHASIPDGGLDRIHETSDGSKSSCTVVGDSATGSQTPSRKRKRSGVLIENDRPAVASTHTCQASSELFCSMVSLSNRLVSMSKTPSSDENDLAGQYMTAVLRTDPDQAASLLSTAIRAAESLILDEKLPPLAQIIVESSPLAPFVSIWDYRSVSTDDLSGRASNVSAQTQMNALYLRFE